ncbi:MAG: altronate dehydrogenase [Planctomycetia bacterium]|nr:altronate dehydrogenase [Planctomycetia bacterium]
METILQFGAGRFLRAFVDRFVQHANDAGLGVGSVVVVQSTPGSRAELLSSGSGGFHVVVRGYEAGEVVDRVETVRSVSRALVASESWPAVLEVARSPELKFIVSNATEAGYVLDDADSGEAAQADAAGEAVAQRKTTVPKTLPGKLTQVLWSRFRAGLEPLTIIPCELIERNAAKLSELVATQAERLRLPGEFHAWLRRCLWLNNLVDCMVTPPPADHPLTKQDPLFTSAEPYTLWAIEKPAGREAPLFAHPAIRIVDDLTPFYLRKVRILNGLHSAMVAKFLPAGFETVQDVLRNAVATRWVRGLLYEEIVPTIAYRVDDVAEFADQTFDRLRNPFMRHKLADIALNHGAKAHVRLKPTHDEYVKLFRTAPKRLAEALAWNAS